MNQVFCHATETYGPDDSFRLLFIHAQMAERAGAGAGGLVLSPQKVTPGEQQTEPAETPSRCTVPTKHGAANLQIEYKSLPQPAEN